MKVVGLRRLVVVEKHVSQGGDGDRPGGLDIEYSPEVGFKYEILLQGSYQKFMLSLSNEYGMCPSYYTTASWGEARLVQVQFFGPMTHTLETPREVDFSESGSEDDEPVEEIWDSRSQANSPRPIDPLALPDNWGCDRYGMEDDDKDRLFSWSRDGGDGYYPRGYVKVNMEAFTPTGRGREKPLIHVFMGLSNLGKTTLGLQLSQSVVYETDQDEKYKPEMAYANVIVMGEKWKDQSFQDIIEFFKKKDLDVDLVPVSFGVQSRF